MYSAFPVWARGTFKVPKQSARRLQAYGEAVSLLNSNFPFIVVIFLIAHLRDQPNSRITLFRITAPARLKNAEMPAASFDISNVYTHCPIQALLNVYVGNRSGIR